MATDSQKKQVEDLDRFEGLLREAWDKPWWREFMKLIGERRLTETAKLVNETLPQRDEDRIRGSITTLAWIMAIDGHGKQLQSGGPTNA